MSSAPIMSPQKRSAMARLLRDWKELQTHPIENIAAEPLEDNIFEWHANLRPTSGPYHESGCLFHVILVFPDEYPARPPQVRLCSTTLKHPNIFHGGYIGGNQGSADGIQYPYVCLDLIKEAASSGPYTGWSTAYSASSLLMQLSAFLFDASVPQEYGGARRNDVDHYQCLAAIREARKFTCSGCKHSLSAPVPYLESNSEPRFDEAQFVAEGERIEALAIQREQERQERRNRHNPRKPVPNVNSRTEFPPLVVDAEAEAELKTEVEEQKQDQTHESQTEKSVSMLDKLPDDLVNLVIGSLDSTDMQRIALLKDERLKQVRDKFHLVAQSELRCYYHRTGLKGDSSAGESDELLGVGLAIDYHKDGTSIRNLSSPLDVLSYRAFKDDGVRLSVWKEAFTHFVPLAINTKHSERALPLLEQELERLRTRKTVGVTASSASSAASSFDPKYTLDILCGLMNSMVVALMKTEPDASDKARELADRKQRHGDYYYSAPPSLPDFKVSVWQSEKAMLGYCAFHHLLLAMCARRPTLQAEAERRVREFLGDVRARTKSSIPNLGELIVLATVVQSCTLEQLLPALLSEMLARNVRWAFREQPLLEAGERVAPCRRISTTFAASRTSLRLLMFQAHFVRSLRNGGNNTAQLNAYNQSFGRPRQGMAEELQKACAHINQVGDWHAFFRTLEMPDQSPQVVHQMLLDAIRRSSILRYHTPSRAAASASAFPCTCTNTCAYVQRPSVAQIAASSSASGPVVSVAATAAAGNKTTTNTRVKMSRRAAMRMQASGSD